MRSSVGASAAGSGRKSARSAGQGQSSKSQSAPPEGGSSAPQGYLAATETPLTSLAFVLPLLVLYEAGTRYFATGQGEQRIVAFNLLQQFFRWCGASGRYLPAMLVVGVLLAWHIARRDRWSVRLSHLLGMAVESALLAVPLLLLCIVAAHWLSRHSLTLWSITRGHENYLVLSLGAGIYEELMFRLMSFAILSFLLVDWLKLPSKRANVAIVVISAVLFSAYHYLTREAFNPQVFAFRTLGGVYFGVIYLCRGFGVTAGTHAAYDVWVVFLKIMA